VGKRNRPMVNIKSLPEEEERRKSQRCWPRFAQ
jgi:hypothetical protein